MKFLTVFPIFQCTWDVLTVYPECSRSVPKVDHCGRKHKYIQNVPLQHISSTPVWHILNFPGWGHCDHTTQVHWKKNCEWATQVHFNCFLWENSRCPQNVPNGDTVVTWPGTLQMYQPLSLMGTLQSHWLGKLKGNSEWATQGHCDYFLWEISRCPQDVPDGDTVVTWSGALWMYCAVSLLGPLQVNWLGKFWKNLWCAEWVQGGFFIHFLTMYLQCPHPGHHLSPPVP